MPCSSLGKGLVYLVGMYPRCIGVEPSTCHTRKGEGLGAFLHKAAQQLVNRSMDSVGRGMRHYDHPRPEGFVELVGVQHGIVKITPLPVTVDNIVASRLQLHHRVGRHRVIDKAPVILGLERQRGKTYCKQEYVIYRNPHKRIYLIKL